MQRWGDAVVQLDLLERSTTELRPVQRAHHLLAGLVIERQPGNPLSILQHLFGDGALLGDLLRQGTAIGNGSDAGRSQDLQDLSAAHPRGVVVVGFVWN